jgi:hypothetical protein
MKYYDTWYIFDNDADRFVTPVVSYEVGQASLASLRKSLPKCNYSLKLKVGSHP